MPIADVTNIASRTRAGTAKADRPAKHAPRAVLEARGHRRRMCPLLRRQLLANQFRNRIEVDPGGSRVAACEVLRRAGSGGAAASDVRASTANQRNAPVAEVRGAIWVRGSGLLDVASRRAGT